ncbi:hypothetical protein [Sphingomonas sp. RS2018]
MDTFSYHGARTRCENRMAADADSAVARIAHRKLAVLHAALADPERAGPMLPVAS